MYVNASQRLLMRSGLVAFARLPPSRSAPRGQVWMTYLYHPRRKSASSTSAISITGRSCELPLENETNGASFQLISSGAMTEKRQRYEI